MLLTGTERPGVRVLPKDANAVRRAMSPRPSIQIGAIASPNIVV
jgi:hypothetical protein